MKVITLGFKGSMFVIFGVFHWVAASPPVFTESPYYSPSTLTEVGSLCKDAVGISMPGDGSPVIITGRHSKLFSFTDCSYSYKGPLPATVYQIEGTGALFDISMFSGPYGNENEVSVFEGCPDEESNGASNTGDDDYTDINDEEIYADTVYTCTRVLSASTIKALDGKQSRERCTPLSSTHIPVEIQLISFFEWELLVLRRFRFVDQKANPLYLLLILALSTQRLDPCLSWVDQGKGLLQIFPNVTTRYSHRRFSIRSPLANRMC